MYLHSLKMMLRYVRVAKAIFRKLFISCILSKIGPTIKYRISYLHSCSVPFAYETNFGIKFLNEIFEGER